MFPRQLNPHLQFGLEVGTGENENKGMPIERQSVYATSQSYSLVPVLAPSFDMATWLINQNDSFVVVEVIRAGGAYIPSFCPPTQ